MRLSTSRISTNSPDKSDPLANEYLLYRNLLSETMTLLPLNDAPDESAKAIPYPFFSFDSFVMRSQEAHTYRFRKSTPQSLFDLKLSNQIRLLKNTSRSSDAGRLTSRIS